MSEQLFKKSQQQHLDIPLPKVIPDVSQWPIYKLSQDKNRFVDEVIYEAKSSLLAQYHSVPRLYHEIAETYYQERIRITRNPWKADPQDEPEFWQIIKKEILEMRALADVPSSYDLLQDPTLHKIIDRYAWEIVGNFTPSAYKLSRAILPRLFGRLLNASPTNQLRSSLFGTKRPIGERFKLIGDLNRIRQLSKIGTLVFVPTHFSNLDSPVIGWAIDAAGLPAVIYGAGLNLFDTKILSYLMHNLGAYKLDRRKKNNLYIETLKNYSKIAIHRGAHSLFFPGGTRSRSGMIEKNLKLGLIHTAIQAQQLNLERNAKPKKIFVIPSTINYHFVLEAPLLIEEHLRKTGKGKYIAGRKEKATSYKVIKFLYQFLTRSSDLTISFGSPMDVFGNEVDDKGQSISHLGQTLDIKDYFITQGKMGYDAQRDFEYTRILGDKIVDGFHKYNVILSSQLVCFTAFQLLKKRYYDIDLYELLRMPNEDTTIHYVEFSSAVERVSNYLKTIAQQGRVILSTNVSSGVEKIISDGIENTGIYHAKHILYMDKNRTIHADDMQLLYFYHNRMLGYGAEKVI